MNVLKKILIVITGVLMIALGIVFFANPVEAFLTLAVFTGVLILAGGVVKIIAFIAGARKDPDGALVLVSGILQLLMGIMLVGNDLFSVAFSIAIIRFYIIFMGVENIAAGAAALQLGFKGAGIVRLILGIVILVLGFFSITTIVAAGFTVFMTAVGLIAAGVASVVSAFIMKPANR
ncbi:MAG: DUF308 domain-containing protein [Parasporobacterium sp.]|nr:DUF308 domain-containing protein [Parasporobacterium sp.]